MMKHFLLAGALLVGTTSFFASCNKDDDGGTSGGKAQVSFRLTDGPADYDAVNLDIQAVEVTMAGSSAVTLTPVHPGVYNILQFSNGLDTLLMRADLPAGTVEQIRLILGSNNTIVVDGTSYPLSTPSGQTSGVKLNLHQTFAAGGAYNVWIDFDAAKSILQTGAGDYKLKPVIRAYSALTDGRIKGYVLPLAAMTTVYAVNGVDTFSAIPNALDGFYRITGLPAGTYNVYYDAGLVTYQDTAINNVTVTYGTEVNLNTITLLP
jgi:hypothetical protein